VRTAHSKVDDGQTLGRSFFSVCTYVTYCMYVHTIGLFHYYLCTSIADVLYFVPACLQEQRATVRAKPQRPRQHTQSESTSKRKNYDYTQQSGGSNSRAAVCTVAIGTPTMVLQQRTNCCTLQGVHVRPAWKYSNPVAGSVVTGKSPPPPAGVLMNKLLMPSVSLSLTLIVSVSVSSLRFPNPEQALV
jgi:hypothetical protein